MKTAGEFVTRHRHLLLIALLSVTLLVSSSANRRRLENEAIVTSVPVMRSADPAAAAVAGYISDRDTTYLKDIDALTELIAQTTLDAQTRQNAADQLALLIHCREARDAIEEALASTDLAPCAAVVTKDAVTIVTAQSTPTDDDAALVITLANAHAGVGPEDVRIITAN